MNKNKNMNNNKKKVYIRPEDVLELIINRIKNNWKTVDIVEENLTNMLIYFKDEKFDRLSDEFDLPSEASNN